MINKKPHHWACSIPKAFPVTGHIFSERNGNLFLEPMFTYLQLLRALPSREWMPNSYIDPFAAWKRDSPYLLCVKMVDGHHEGLCKDCLNWVTSHILFFKVNSMSKVGLNLRTPRLRLTCSTNLVSQALLRFLMYHTHNRWET